MKVKPFTGPDGADHPNAVWLPTQFQLDNQGKTGRITFNCYHDAASLAAGKLPVAGASKSYIVNQAAYTALTGSVVTGNMIDAMSAAGYALAMSTLDTLDPANPTGPRVSFFHGCADA